jgi:hypothetical protein
VQASGSLERPAPFLVSAGYLTPCDVGAAGESPADQRTAAQTSRTRKFSRWSSVAAMSASRTQQSSAFQGMARLSSERRVTDLKRASSV